MTYVEDGLLFLICRQHLTCRPPFFLLDSLAAFDLPTCRFDSPLGFEPTPEVAIFDLLGITLIHGWLVDPMDAPTTAALGSRSYNEVRAVLR